MSDDERVLIAFGDEVGEALRGLSAEWSGTLLWTLGYGMAWSFQKRPLHKPGSPLAALHYTNNGSFEVMLVNVHSPNGRLCCSMDPCDPATTPTAVAKIIVRDWALWVGT